MTVLAPYVFLAFLLMVLFIGLYAVRTLYARGPRDADSRNLHMMLMGMLAVLVFVLMSFVIHFQSNRIDVHIHFDLNIKPKPPSVFRQLPPSRAEIFLSTPPFKADLFFGVDFLSGTIKIAIRNHLYK